METIIRYDELHLKSEPVKRQMLRELRKNIIRTTGNSVKIVNGRVVVDDYNEQIKKKLEHTFGIASFSPVLTVEKDMKSIEKAVSHLMKGFSKKKTFKIEAVRADKTFPRTSQQIKEQIGEIFFNQGYKVKMKDPNKTITIEIRDKSYVYDTTEKGPGGMPLQTAGYFSSQLHDTKDMLAIWMMMKRGAFPILTGKVSKTLQKNLENWTSGLKIKISDKINTTASVTSETDISNLNKLSKETFAPLVGLNQFQVKKMVSLIK